jgi:hypothetical protein
MCSLILVCTGCMSNFSCCQKGKDSILRLQTSSSCLTPLCFWALFSSFLFNLCSWNICNIHVHLMHSFFCDFSCVLLKNNKYITKWMIYCKANEYKNQKRLPLKLQIHKWLHSSTFIFTLIFPFSVEYWCQY